MVRSVPKALILILISISFGSFVGSIYLEADHLDLLQRHPIMVNLVSGVVGFSSGALAVAVGFNWFAVRQRASDVGHYLTGLTGGIDKAVSQLMTEFANPAEVKAIPAEWTHKEYRKYQGLPYFSWLSADQFVAPLNKLSGDDRAHCIERLVALVGAPVKPCMEVLRICDMTSSRAYLISEELIEISEAFRPQGLPLVQVQSAIGYQIILLKRITELMLNSPVLRAAHLQKRRRELKHQRYMDRKTWKQKAALQATIARVPEAAGVAEEATR